MQAPELRGTIAAAELMRRLTQSTQQVKDLVDEDFTGSRELQATARPCAHAPSLMHVFCANLIAAFDNVDAV
jgi:hypothetical protein